MKRRIKNVVAVTTLALTASASISADACDRGGRRISISRRPSGLSYSPFNHYPQPAYNSTPVYSQPQVVYQQQPVQNLPPSQVAPTGIPNTPAPQQPTNPALLSRQPSTAPQQAPAAGQTTVRNNAAPAAPAATQGQSNATNAEASALQLLASIMTTDSTPTDTTAASNTPQIPEFAPSSASSEPAHVGTWNVNLPGNQAVQLVLNADGSFTWTATKNGNSSNFKGQYRLENDRLTLVRSTDLNQMAGSWTVAGEGFTFKLDGATTGGLTFRRS